MGQHITRAGIGVGIGAALAMAAAAVRRHRHHVAPASHVAGGILVGDADTYDTFTRAVFGSFYREVATDVAAVAPDGARVLEVGCGPGQLAMLLADEHGLEVTGVDLDAAMINRAERNAAARMGAAGGPVFQVGDAASLPFPDSSFDLAVSTLSLHHWDDPTRGLAEIARVVRPGGRMLVWDLRPGIVPFHAHMPDPVEHARRGGLRVASAASWRWPWVLPLTHRTELVHGEEAEEHDPPRTPT